MNSASKAERRALSRRARDNPPAMGVYAVRCRATGHLVLRASVNLDGAMNRDRFELRLGRHRDPQLQAAWNSGEEAAVLFEVIEVIRPKPDDPAFDPREALDLALQLWRAELMPPQEAA